MIQGEAMKRIYESEFEKEVLKDAGKVLVNFHADWSWCPESSSQMTLLETLAHKLEGVEGLKFVQVDVDENINLATLYRIDTLPTFVLFKNGEPIHRAVGLQSESSIRRILGVMPLETSGDKKGEEITAVFKRPEMVQTIQKELGGSQTSNPLS